MHEASLYADNSFITLTYDDENLPVDHSLDKKHFQKFIRSLRDANRGERVRYYHCGEYGTNLSRPHYHAILFNYDFYDKELWKVENGNKIYISDELSSYWGRGYVTLGEVTSESAGYVARYCTKKITGTRADEHYYTVDKYGEFRDGLQPEYATMSSKPGIGADWFQQYIDDVYPSDEVVIKRKDKYVSVKPPRYYDNLLRKVNPNLYDALKAQRIASSKLHAADNTRERLAVRQTVKLLQTQQLHRNYEHGT